MANKDPLAATIARLTKPAKQTTAKQRAAKYKPPPRTADQKYTATVSKLPPGARKALTDLGVTGPEHRHGVGGFLTNLSETPEKLTMGLVESGKLLGTAAYHDISSGKGITKPGGLLFGDSEGRDVALGMVKGIPQSAKLLADPHEWYDNPGVQVLNLASFVLPAARAASVGRLAMTIRAANPELSALQVNKAALAESFHPGFAAAKGIKGGIEARTIGGVAGRMPSRQPAIRQALKAYDKASAKLDEIKPGAKFGTEQRAARAAQRNAAQAVRRAAAQNKYLERDLVEGIVGTKGAKAKLRKWFDRPGKTPPHIGAAMAAILQAPKGMTPRAAVELAASGKESILSQNASIMGDLKRVDDLTTRRDDALAAGVKPPKGIDKQITEAQARVDSTLGKVAPVKGSASRARIINTMETSVGTKRANQLIKLYDKAARGLSPEDPHGWYDNLEARLHEGDPNTFEPAGEALYQRMWGGKSEGWYHPLDRELQALAGKPRQRGQLLADLKAGGVTAEELRNSGLAQTLKGNEVVDPQQVIDELNQQGYWSTYDPDITITRSPPPGVDPNTVFTPKYEVPQLVSRDGNPGEYYEMVVRYPELLGTRAGSEHWGQNGNTYHVRFSVFTDENNRRTMLIEEIQSDWASDYRKAGKEGTQEKTPEETAAEEVAHDERVTAAGEDLAVFQQRVREIGAEIQEHADNGVDWETIPGLRQRLSDAVSGVNRTHDRLNLAERERQDFHRYVSSRVPPSPMGNKYVNNAARQVLSWADDNGVDRVVLIDGHTQALRNKALDLGPDEGVDVLQAESRPAYAYGGTQFQMGEWVDEVTGEPLTTDEITQMLREQGPAGHFTRAYGSDGHPGEWQETFKKVAGAEGRYSDDAYTGRYSAQAEHGDQFDGYVQPEEGPMPGTEFEMTPEVKNEIRKAKPLYRLDPDGIPQGATEFLSNGKRRITMFETANVSTWVHELAHVALPDLDPRDLRTLEHEVAEGRAYADWTTDDKERFARSFETYLRDGHAEPVLRDVFAKITKWMREIWRQTAHEAEEISPQTAEVFDRMLGRRYQNSVVLKPREVKQVQYEVEQLRKALDSGDVDRLGDASDALEEMAKQAEEAGLNILLRNAKSPEHAAAIAEGMARRKNAVVEDYRRRGLIGYGEEARGYFPHLSMFEALGTGPVEPSRVGAVTDVVGTPRVPSKALARKRNQLIRHQTGEVLNDPTVVAYILKARLKILETIKARNELWERGDPVSADEPLPDYDFMYVRNPNVPPEKLRSATQGAARLSREDFGKLSSRHAAEDIDEMTTDVDGVMGEMFYDPKSGKEKPTWVEGEDNVRTVPRSVVRTRLGDVFATSPTGKLGAVGGIANSLFRIASIYLPFWRYLPVNYAQNAVMVALTNPAAFSKLLTGKFHGIRKADPQLADMIREEVGTIQATALPEFHTRAQGRLQRVERNLNQASGQWGEILGKGADVPMRAAVWLRHAEKYGFTTNKELRDLITSEDPAKQNVRDIISQRTKEDLIDFDTLNPWEKEVATRFLALWPFIRGITKWPLMYAREYPGRLAAASLLGQANQQEASGLSVREQGMASMLGNIVNLGKFDPSQPGREMAETLFATVRANGGVLHGEQPNFDPLVSSYAAPQIKEALGMSTGEGRGNWLEQVMTTFFPGAGPAYKVGKGGSIAKQAARQLSLIQEAGAATAKDVNEFMAPADAVAEQMRAAGLEPPPQVTVAQQLRAPYADWKFYESRIKYSRRDQGKSDALTKGERVTGLLAVAERYYPQLYAEANASAQASGWDSMQELAASGTGSDYLAEVDRYLHDQMFGVMTDMKRDAKEAGWKVPE